MSTKTDDLKQIFMDVSDEATFTERQEEGPSRDPISDREAEIEAEVSAFAREDGLDDAVDSDLGEGGTEA